MLYESLGNSNTRRFTDLCKATQLLEANYKFNALRKTEKLTGNDASDGLQMLSQLAVVRVK